MKRCLCSAIKMKRMEKNIPEMPVCFSWIDFSGIQLDKAGRSENTEPLRQPSSTNQLLTKSSKHTPVLHWWDEQWAANAGAYQLHSQHVLCLLRAPVLVAQKQHVWILHRGQGRIDQSFCCYVIQIPWMYHPLIWPALILHLIYMPCQNICLHLYWNCSNQEYFSIKKTLDNMKIDVVLWKKKPEALSEESDKRISGCWVVWNLCDVCGGGLSGRRFRAILCA